MRRSWKILISLGIVPVVVFYLLDWSGATNSLGYISTTMWQVGSPSVWDLLFMFLSVISWTWVKGFANLFLLAAVPFILADIAHSARARRS